MYTESIAEITAELLVYSVVLCEKNRNVFKESHQEDTVNSHGIHR